jgi:hypothetical protein
MKAFRLALLMAVASTAGFAAAAEVVVLRGGVRIELKQPPVRQGNNVLLTRRDGTLLSVPYTEIDTKATAEARAAAAPAPPAAANAAPPATPAEAARATREGPKARLRLTDADVGHYLESVSAPGEEKKDESTASGLGRVDVADYTQTKNGDNLIVRGMLRNLGTTSALNTRLTVAAVDDKGQIINAAEATVSSGTVEPGKSVGFSATIPVGPKTAAVIRFMPQWVPQTPPAEAQAPAGTSAASTAAGTLPGSGTPGTPATAPASASTARAAAQPPATPYGQGLTFAAPAPPSRMDRPEDGRTGYIPGAATPENQPKPPE